MARLSPSEFAAKWKGNERTERAAAQEHFIDLCQMLGVATPNEADPKGEWYAFEKGAEKVAGGDGFADVWKRGHFAWEYKGKHLQGCWLNHEREPDAATRLDAPFFSQSEMALWGPPDFEGPPPLYGFARIHGRYVVPCAAYLGLGEGYMFLSLSFRAPALRPSMPPEIEPEGSCGPKMFAWLAEIGRSVHARVPIRAAVIGWEPTMPNEGELHRRDFEPTYGYLLPRGSESDYVAPTRFSRP